MRVEGQDIQIVSKEEESTSQIDWYYSERSCADCNMGIVFLKSG